jgi:GTP cyclohydrolase I
MHECSEHCSVYPHTCPKTKMNSYTLDANFKMPEASKPPRPISDKIEWPVVGPPRGNGEEINPANPRPKMHPNEIPFEPGKLGDVFDGATGRFTPADEQLPYAKGEPLNISYDAGGSLPIGITPAEVQQQAARDALGIDFSKLFMPERRPSADFSFAEQAKTQELEAAAETLLGGIVPGFSMKNEHSAATPGRFVKMLRQLCEPEPEWNFTTFPAHSDNMVTLSPIPFYTLCAHHVVPFHGTVHVGYVPDRTIAGLSKFPRAVRAVAKGLHVQEELTAKIADFLEEKLKPKGVAVVMKAEHMCMAMRGVEVAGVITTTAEMRGVFSDHTRTAKAEFLQWISHA